MSSGTPSRIEPPAPPAEPVWLPTEPDPVFALLHRPVPGAGRATAVLFCPPFGWEEMCSYRPRREWANALARAGFPCARIDLPGTGDSGGSPRDGGRLPAWVDAVGAAAAWLRDAAGATRVVALGVGLGGMLACLAADAGAPIDDFILWGVSARGSRLLRELKAYAGVVRARYPDDPDDDALPEGDLNLSGFRLSSETAGAIEQVRLDVPAGRRRALLLGRDDLPVDTRLREAFERAGADVTVETASGYELLMNPPQEAMAPHETIDRTTAWLADSPERAPAAEPRPAAAARPAPATALLRGAAPVRETAFRLTGELAGTFAVLSEGAESERSRLCAVWLNGGALHHIGPNRAWVEIARRWAARGVPTVRVDLAGIGESEGDAGRPLADRRFYVAERNRETLAIVEQLAARGIGDQFVLGGLCSGAYWALQAALADPRVVGTMLINLYTVFWTEPLADELDTERSLDALQGRAWRKLLRRDVSREQVRDALTSLRPARLRARRGHPVQRAQAAQVIRALDQLRDQGTEALVLLSGSERLPAQLGRQGVLDQLDRWPNLSITEIPTADHLFRGIWAQQHVHDCLDRALERVLSDRGVTARSPAA